MVSDLMLLVGGLGLFLLGMVIMTDGLHSLAGDYLHRVLARFTGSPVSGAISGATSTAMLQSSSATTVAAVAFVGAGLLTFPQALGVIFGANLGTTITGWLVALLGLKLKLGDVVLPLILVGMLMRLFGAGRIRHAGFAIAGFALIFVGISTLQQGMSAYHGLVTPADFPSDTLSGRLQLVATGIAITLVTQSSSAGVATALTAVYTGTISFPQAAALVIGMDVGTTVTAALATIGGSAATRRTGYSHVVYNLMTAIGALLLLSPYVWSWEAIAPGALAQHAELALVGFHSLFNLVGVAAVLPFTNRFAALMVKLVPDPADPLLDSLDQQMLRHPGMALNTVSHTLAGLTQRTFSLSERLLRLDSLEGNEVAQLGRHLDGVHQYLDRIHLRPGHDTDWKRLNAAMHMLDHLQRMHERCEEEPERAARLADVPLMAAEVLLAADGLHDACGLLKSGDLREAAKRTGLQAQRVTEQVDGMRTSIMATIASGELDVPSGTQRLEGLRWLRRVNHHAARVCHHGATLWGMPPTP